MKHFALICFLFFVPALLNAQDYDTLDQPVIAPRYHFGFALGVGQPFVKEVERNITDLDASITDTLDQITYTGIGSPYINIIFEFDFTKHISLRFTPGISLNKYMTYHHWENGIKTTSLSVLNLVRLPFHLNYKIPYKLCSFNFLPGMSYILGNNSNPNLSIPLKSLAVDSGIEFTRNFTNLIVGVETRYIAMLGDFNAMRFIGQTPYTDKMHMNYMQVGITLKY
ncbi:MAG TPA: hypothetical protein VD905_21145 [Flavobacteriales bacterium]|nr:hypothetical protein [Flavobacteriales bacterium]